MYDYKNLQGKILIAHPNAPKDTIFHKSVIYIYQHSLEKGSLGLILNKPSRYTVQDICDEKKIQFSGNVPAVYHGGPVNSQALVLLHTDDWATHNTARVSGNLMISSDDFMLEKLAHGDAPAHWRLFAGMSGWSPLQIEAELNGKWPYRAEHSWLIADPTENLVFSNQHTKLWEESFKLCGSQMFDQYF